MKKDGKYWKLFVIGRVSDNRKNNGSENRQEQ